MESLTTMRTIKVSRKDANNFRLKGLVDRTDLACPGTEITLKNVSYGKAVKMIKTGTMDVLTPDTANEWTHVPNGDYDTLTKVYTDKEVKVEEPEIIVTNEPEEEPVVEEVEEVVDESDDEDPVDESTSEEVVEEAPVDTEQTVEETVTETVAEETTTDVEEITAEDNSESIEDEKVEEVVEESSEVAPTVVETEPTQTATYIPKNNNNKNIHYNYKKKK